MVHTNGAITAIVDMGSLMGVILCGGDSRRMGRDKGLLQKNGIPWAKHMADKLTPHHLPIVFSIKASQLEEYSIALPGSHLLVDDANADGPLKGVLTVHAQFPDKDLLLLGCDMLDMDAMTLQGLITAWQTGGYEFYAYSEGEFFQPLSAIYTASALDKARAGSLQKLLRQGKTKSLVIHHDEAFRNYNTL